MIFLLMTPFILAVFMDERRPELASLLALVSIALLLLFAY